MPTVHLYNSHHGRTGWLSWGGIILLIYIASELVISGYDGIMSSINIKLKSDTRVLSYKTGCKLDAQGALKLRVASATVKEAEKKSFIEYTIATQRPTL